MSFHEILLEGKLTAAREQLGNAQYWVTELRSQVEADEAIITENRARIANLEAERDAERRDHSATRELYYEVIEQRNAFHKRVAALEAERDRLREEIPNYRETIVWPEHERPGKPRRELPVDPAPEERIAELEAEQVTLRETLALADMALDTAEAHIDESKPKFNALALQEIAAARLKIAGLATPQAPTPCGPWPTER